MRGGGEICVSALAEHNQSRMPIYPPTRFYRLAQKALRQKVMFQTAQRGNSWQSRLISGSLVKVCLLSLRRLTHINYHLLVLAHVYVLFGLLLVKDDPTTDTQIIDGNAKTQEKERTVLVCPGCNVRPLMIHAQDERVFSIFNQTRQSNTADSSKLYSDKKSHFHTPVQTIKIAVSTR